MIEDIELIVTKTEGTECRNILITCENYWRLKKATDIIKETFLAKSDSSFSPISRPIAWAILVPLTKLQTIACAGPGSVNKQNSIKTADQNQNTQW